MGAKRYYVMPEEWVNRMKAMIRSEQAPLMQQQGYQNDNYSSNNDQDGGDYEQSDNTINFHSEMESRNNNEQLVGLVNVLPTRLRNKGNKLHNKGSGFTLDSHQASKGQ